MRDYIARKLKEENAKYLHKRANQPINERSNSCRFNPILEKINITPELHLPSCKGWSNTLENVSISCLPNIPSSTRHDLHEAWSHKIMFSP
jgi:hypothetical protein